MNLQLICVPFTTWCCVLVELFSDIIPKTIVFLVIRSYWVIRIVQPRTRLQQEIRTNYEKELLFAVLLAYNKQLER